MAQPKRADPAEWLLEAVDALPAEKRIAVMSWLMQRVGRPPLQPALLPVAGIAGPPSPTDREQQLLLLLARGSTVEAAAKTLGVSHNTALNHLRNINLRMVTEATSDPPLAPVLGGGEVTTFPVRLPRSDYEHLKAWCEEHKFTMAVVVRGLVEQFLRRQSGGGGRQVQ